MLFRRYAHFCEQTLTLHAVPRNGLGWELPTVRMAGLKELSDQETTTISVCQAVARNQKDLINLRYFKMKRACFCYMCEWLRLVLAYKYGIFVYDIFRVKLLWTWL